MNEKPEEKDEELIIFNATPIWKDGRILSDEKEIIEYIDTYMKPESLNDFENQKDWFLLRAHLMHMYLTTQEERVESFLETFENEVDFKCGILKRMQEKYPEYW
jgi:hypothetical protein